MAGTEIVMTHEGELVMAHYPLNISQSNPSSWKSMRCQDIRCGPLNSTSREVRVKTPGWSSEHSYDGPSFEEAEWCGQDSQTPSHEFCGFFSWRFSSCGEVLFAV